MAWQGTDLSFEALKETELLGYREKSEKTVHCATMGMGALLQNGFEKILILKMRGIILRATF